MNKAITLCVAVSFALSACADKSQNVQSQYISPLNYQSFSCSQIEQEARRVTSRASQVAGVQDKNAQGDAVATGVAIVLFWPAAFFVSGNKENAAELSRLKGELEALEKASIQKNCGIVFPKPKPAEALQDKPEKNNSGAP